MIPIYKIIVSLVAIAVLMGIIHTLFFISLKTLLNGLLTAIMTALPQVINNILALIFFIAAAIFLSYVAYILFRKRLEKLLDVAYVTKLVMVIIMVLTLGFSMFIYSNYEILSNALLTRTMQGHAIEDFKKVIDTVSVLDFDAA